jgi:hypothetical protein
MKSVSAPRRYGQWLLPCMLVTAAVGMACGEDTGASANKDYGGDAGQPSQGGSDGSSGHDAGGSSTAPAGGAGAVPAGADVGGNPGAGADPGSASAGAAGSTQAGSGGAAGSTGEDAGGASGSDGAGGDGGDGGDGGFTAGLCQEIDPINPALPASCAASVGDSDCVACVKVHACDEYETCFGQQLRRLAAPGRSGSKQASSSASPSVLLPIATARWMPMSYSLTARLSAASAPRCGSMMRRAHWSRRPTIPRPVKASASPSSRRHVRRAKVRDRNVRCGDAVRETADRNGGKLMRRFAGPQSSVQPTLGAAVSAKQSSALAVNSAPARATLQVSVTTSVQLLE